MATGSPGQATTAHHADPHTHEAALPSSLWAPGPSSASAVCAAAATRPDLTMAGAAGSGKGG